MYDIEDLTFMYNSNKRIYITPCYVTKTYIDTRILTYEPSTRVKIYEFLKSKNRAKVAPDKYQKAYNKNQALKHERRYKQMMKIKKEK